MDEHTKQHIWEAIKEAGRYVLSGIVGYVLTEGVIETIVTYFAGTKLDPSMKVIAIGLVGSAFRSLDKYLHEKGKGDEETTGKTSVYTLGLTRF